MSRAIRNFEITLENPYRKQVVREEGPVKAVDANFWRLLNRIPRALSFSYKQKQEKTEESLPNNMEERLIVISSFKNTESTEASPLHKFNLRNNPTRRFISDDDINLIHKFIRKEHNKSEREEEAEQNVEKDSPLRESYAKGRITDLAKRVNLSGGNQIKPRQIVSK
jgi:hypothetical protein